MRQWHYWTTLEAWQIRVLYRPDHQRLRGRGDCCGHGFSAIREECAVLCRCLWGWRIPVSHHAVLSWATLPIGGGSLRGGRRGKEFPPPPLLLPIRSEEFRCRECCLRAAHPEETRAFAVL